MTTHIASLSDGRRIEAYQSGKDKYSVRINVIGPKGAVRESFILDRLSLERLLATTQPLTGTGPVTKI